MKVMVKKITLCIVLMLMCLTTVGIRANADGSLMIGMDQYRTEAGKILIYVNHNKGYDFNPDMAESSVVVGKQSLPIEEINKFGDIGEPVSYMFMVDISGSMDKNRIATIKETLQHFIDTKKAGDNFCITTMGDELVSTGFSEDTQALSNFVAGIEVTRQDTDLYKSIKEELNILKTDKSVHRKRCLVIFSDGADDQKDGITKEEAETQVKELHIPVFTVALLPKNYKEKDLESAKILGSFARYSAGGEHYVPAIDQFECVNVCEKITGVINNSLIVKADLADVVADDGNIYLGVSLSKGPEKDKDGMQIPVGDILNAIKEAKSIQVNVNVNNGETEVTEEPKEESDSNVVIILSVAGAAVVLIGILVIVIVAGKKKNESASATNIGGMCNVDSESSKTIGFGQSAPEPAAPKQTGNAKTVVLYKIGPGGEEKYELVLDEKKSIGRKKTCSLSFENDNALSSVHCYIYGRGKKVYVQDNGSTNGTYINGVPITGEYCVESGDILLVGSAEYRIVQK